MIILCQGLTIAKELKEINLVRNEFGEDDTVLQALYIPMMKNSKLRTYYLHDNGLYAKGMNIISGGENLWVYARRKECVKNNYNNCD